jgi:hypothetical protein
MFIDVFNFDFNYFRKEFLSFLRRPDEKEEYVLQWQNHYNEVSEDMRGDDEVKAELHQEVDVRFLLQHI